MTDTLDTPLSVLVADDNADAADSLAQLVALRGHRPRVAHGGRDALRLAAEAPPDVAILDLLMPDLDGWAVARYLVAADRPPVVAAVTGCDDRPGRNLSTAAGIRFHIVKPVDPVVILDLLDWAVRTKWPDKPGHRELKNRANSGTEVC
ncbi:response regulator [Limnoglobus roseus]|uniref:Response regulator n=1 Tax=Limnoglobus roseus TaxID=2598579 RepID=A0A5C1AQQ0_9BACT|nr:response regulator [Limnoglobus roseus]QEL20517.1 response regulator [Limnoglobus roseus]